MAIRVQTEKFDAGAEVSRFTDGLSASGAVVSFSGIVRDEADDLSAMEIECYPGMTERALEKIVAEAHTRWALEDVLVIHRHGVLQAREVIMMVATASKHRVDAFEAAEFLMDYLKSRAPFWKKESTAQGAHWVASKDEDENALSRWSKDQG